MLKKILSVTGRPGLFRLISQGRNALIVEDVTSGHRFPVHSRDKIVSLADIAMYTLGQDLPLSEILQRLYDHEKGAQIDIKALATNDQLREKFAEVVEDFDRDRVYPSDIRKLFTWYNTLVGAGFDKFTEEQTAEEPTEEK